MDGDVAKGNGDCVYLPLLSSFTVYEFVSADHHVVM